ncbi:type IX secretion system outer membrane channel protein PorV [Fluviicola chungangensis]|uniref:Type IX secretion system outer membrane channel protein PorV n=1 Tax=Fluviicola chungangensis TaxID=2597671 RepID=A0A556MJU9_9FLAO|nr:type IX secretion system outer membrane channel protein PorV [Fluviicola chungangensis]TSJ40139.1 type IX secretion system outer membrane channel protein PorV [Fluviicola chungangensis]
MLSHKLLVINLFVGFLSFSQANGQGVTQNDIQLNTITTALPFLGINPDSRSGAMGDAGTALSPNSSSIMWNTAMLNFSEAKSEIGVSYTPWLRQLTNDMHLSYLSGYSRVGERHVIGGALRYFSLGEITFTDNAGNTIREFKPNEFELTLGYAFKLAEKHSIGVNGKFAYSNLTGGLVTQGTETKAAIAGIADISYAYRTEDINWFKVNGVYALGVTITNIGNKVAYSANARRDFLPTTLKIGNAYTAKIDKYNSLTVSVDIAKLLVPTPPVYATINGEQTLISGKNNDVGVIAGMVQSFYDAPGRVLKDENGDPIDNGDGTYQVKKGSKFGEEMREIMIGSGLEYWYNNIFALRGGYFYENISKGGRQFFTMGVGFKYNIFSFDFSYLAALKRNNPLANTMRFTLRFTLGDKMNDKESKPE